MASTSTTTKQFEYQADINSVMNIIINSVYSNKEVFLRELISNASDALDKIRHMSLTDKSVLGDQEELTIRVIPDTDAGSLTIEDTGIGMTYQDLINNIGTIANSGTKAFLQQIKEGKADANMIGQFGVGFYSAFLVADRIQIFTKNNDDQEYVWETAENNSFTIRQAAVDAGDPNLTRGTRIVLWLKDDCKDYAQETTLRRIVKAHSEFITYPIRLRTVKTVEEEVPIEKEDSDSTDKTDGGDDEATIVEVDENENEVVETKKVTVKKEDWEHLNKVTPIWLRNPSDVSPEEYETFYTAITNDRFGCASVKHFTLEGQVNVRGILYLPKKVGMDVFNAEKMNNIKMYVNRVFVTDDCQNLIPSWMSFVRGVIESEDLPLTVSREVFQDSRVVKSIGKTLVKKTIEMLTELMEDEDTTKFKAFYNEFSNSLKYAAYSEKESNQVKLMKLLRYFSTHSTAETSSLTDYVKRMPEKQTHIYYVCGLSMEAIQDSPFLETIRRQGYEVLYMTDPLDEHLYSKTANDGIKFEGKSFSNVVRETLHLEFTEEENTEFAETQKRFEETCKFVQEVVGDMVSKVTLSRRLTVSPCVITTVDHTWTANMDRIMRARAIQQKSPMHGFMGPKQVMELNPNNKIVQKIQERLEANETNLNDKSLRDMVTFVYETAALVSGFGLKNPVVFGKKINRMINLGMSIEDDEDSLPADDHAGDDDDTAMVDEENNMEEVD